MEHEDPTPPRALLPAAALIVVTASAALLYSVDASVGRTAIDLPAQDDRVLSALAPQGWGFFSRDPQAASVYVLKREAGVWRSAGPEGNSEPSNAFGFRREPRARGVEAGLLKGELDEGEWHECRTEPAACAEQLPVSARLTNPSPAPLLCGDLALVERAPVPWAWSRSSTPVVMPSVVTRIEVRC